MDKKKYIGHSSQLSGIEEHRLIGGKGDGMRLFQVRNGKGLEFTVSADRCADISRLSYQGLNMNYFSPCGYVGSQYFDKEGFEFLKSFTCGFFTTCGLHSIGTPSTDDGNSHPLHGTISHVPAEQIYGTEENHNLVIHAVIKDAQIFKHKMVINRSISCSTNANRLQVIDKITNEGDTKEPLMLLYHINLGYPLLSECTQLVIPSDEVIPRDERAKEGLNVWNVMTQPQPNFEEQCYYHLFKAEMGKAKVFNETIQKGLVITYDTKNLPILTEWKMMGETDYVLGIEPATNYLDGRNELHKKGELKYIHPGETLEFGFQVDFYDNKSEWENDKKSE